MLDPRVTVEDLRVFWKGCAAFYKGSPVLVISVGSDGGKKVAQIKDLKDGGIKRIIIDSDDTLTPPDSRLGLST